MSIRMARFLSDLKRSISPSRAPQTSDHLEIETIYIPLNTLKCFHSFPCFIPVTLSPKIRTQDLKIYFCSHFSESLAFIKRLFWTGRIYFLPIRFNYWRIFININNWLVVFFYGNFRLKIKFQSGKIYLGTTDHSGEFFYHVHIIEYPRPDCPQNSKKNFYHWKILRRIFFIFWNSISWRSFGANFDFILF